MYTLYVMLKEWWTYFHKDSRSISTHVTYCIQYYVSHFMGYFSPVMQSHKVSLPASLPASTMLLIEHCLSIFTGKLLPLASKSLQAWRDTREDRERKSRIAQSRADWLTDRRSCLTQPSITSQTTITTTTRPPRATTMTLQLLTTLVLALTGTFQVHNNPHFIYVKVWMSGIGCAGYTSVLDWSWGHGKLNNYVFVYPEHHLPFGFPLSQRV